MALLENLTKIFLKKNIFQTLLILFLICFISFLKINVISYLTANIIKSIQSKNINLVFNYYKYFIFVSLFYIFLHIIYKFSQNRLLIKLRLWIKSSIVKYIMINNNNEYSDINFSKLNSPIQRASSLLYFLLQTIVSKFIPEISIVIVIAIFFIYKNPSFGTIFLIGNIILLGYCYYITKKYIKHNLVCEDSMHDSELILTEILNNIDKIIFRGYYKDETNNFLNHSETVNKVHNDYYNYLIKEIFIIDSLLFGLIFILIYFIIRMFILKQIDITIFITFFTMILLYRDSILNPIKDIPDYIDFFGRVTKLNDILYHVKIKDNIIVKNKHLNFNNIKFQNINFKYKKSKRNILNNLNLDIKINNNIIGIIGKSGSGKSTLLKLLLNIFKYDGNIYIDNINTKDLDIEYIRKNIVYVNQTAKLFDKKIKDNIFYGCEKNEESKKYFNEIMNFNNIKEIFQKFDYTKNVGFSGENLSGGQRQIINIINGLITPSKILILDEPTNALDNALKQDIIDLIKYFKKYKKCIIIISHDNDIFRIFDETIEIK